MTDQMPSIVRSVRMSPDLWAFVASRAKLKGVTVNAWMVRCVEDARKRLGSAND